MVSKDSRRTKDGEENSCGLLRKDSDFLNDGDGPPGGAEGAVAAVPFSAASSAAAVISRVVLELEKKSIRVRKGILGFRVSDFPVKKRGKRGKKEKKTPELFPEKRA